MAAHFLPLFFGALFFTTSALSFSASVVCLWTPKAKPHFPPPLPHNLPPPNLRQSLKWSLLQCKSRHQHHKPHPESLILRFPSQKRGILALHAAVSCPPAKSAPVDTTLRSASSRKCRSSIAVVVLVIALLCSMLYSAVLSDTNSRLSNELSDAHKQLASDQQVIGNYKGTVLSLREYNRYLQDDVEQMCRVPSDYEFAKSRYLARQNLAPLPRFKNFT